MLGSWRAPSLFLKVCAAALAEREGERRGSCLCWTGPFPEVRSNICHLNAESVKT